MLDRRPPASGASIEPHVSHALIALTGQLDSPAFARSASFVLRDGDIALQKFGAMGLRPTAAFSLTLGREAALRVLAALRGEASGMGLECQVERRGAASAEALTVRGRLADVVAALGTADLLDRTGIGGIARSMLASGRLSVSTEVEPDDERLVDGFLAMARPILRPITTEAGRRWRVLAVTPNPMTLSGRIESADAATLEQRIYTRSLEALLAPVATADDIDTFVRIVAPDGRGGLGPVPRLLSQPTKRGGPTTIKLARFGRADLVQLQAVAQPSSAKVNAHAMIATANAAPLAATATIKPSYVAIADLQILPLQGTPGAEALPQVDQKTAPLWRDQIDPNRFWYPPAFSLALPAAADDPDGAVFGMTFRAEGHRSDGTPGLNGNVYFRLERGMSADTQAAWEAAGKPAIAPVPADNLSVQLLVPFRDEAGETRTQAFAADLREEGEAVHAEIGLIDDWVRLAYGSLAFSGFQNRPPELSVAYSFRGYVPITEGNLQLLFDRKAALVALATGPRTRSLDVGYLDTEMLAWSDGAASVKLTREADVPRTRAALTPRPAIGAVATLAVKPNLLQAATVTELLRKHKYGVQGIARAQLLPAAFPCDNFGAFYREEKDGAFTVIGCQDAFRLGQTVYRQFERIDDLSDAAASVWRSLQQPGRFLVVPARWSIGRFDQESPAERAYRPAIFLYSSVDPDDASKNRTAMLASLVPDIDPARTLAIRQDLRGLASAPLLLSLNDIEAQIDFRWTVPTLPGLTVNAVKLGACIQVTAECPLDTTPLLLSMLETSGLTGAVGFALPDGTKIDCDLGIDLARIIGPMPGGPVVVERGDGVIRLRNPIERPVDISEIVAEPADGEPVRIAVDRRIEPGASIDIAAEPPAGELTVVCAPADGTATLTEIRSFIEDVHTNVTFVNLVNYANHALAALTAEVRIRDIEGSQQLPLDENQPVCSLGFVLPLTRYLVSPIVEFAVTKSFDDGTTSTTGWLEWSLADDGNVVSLTWERIA
ncbi:MULTISPECIES: hypothetical protein [unclassified Sphingomonas]|uniref:hypothetical protein n=1 Tax=unclassified Sphingomonas TaxID=196159 RepID=UPI000700EABA|nr:MULTISPECIES: hypothetical protein [unclassified Sphingomonas]KQX17949.1 hypothetical protein ASD17_19830 [Sphingomonas sp. Root1294]KQY70874.1 hypothetical protein ASD39_23730 [Sphingomonas sp. Root50]KRB91632.1 hypothetical protein ASE22_06580 [Sphingomonas sp. Root720]